MAGIEIEKILDERRSGRSNLAFVERVGRAKSLKRVLPWYLDVTFLDYLNAPSLNQ